VLGLPVSWHGGGALDRDGGAHHPRTSRLFIGNIGWVGGRGPGRWHTARPATWQRSRQQAPQQPGRSNNPRLCRLTQQLKTPDQVVGG
jgi:hypothetical protein